LCFQVALFVWPPIRLVVFSLPFRRDDPKALAAFTMIGIYVLNVVMGGTAAGGGAPWTLLLIIAGWSAVLLARPIVARETVKSWQTQFGIRRVMV